MKKQEFTKIMKRLVSIKKDEENLNKALKKFDPDLNYLNFSRYETLVADTLKIAMNDTADWISWWLWECDYGNDKDLLNSGIDKIGNKIKVKTLSDLYDLIKIYE